MSETTRRDFLSDATARGWGAIAGASLLVGGLAKQSDERTWRRPAAPPGGNAAAAAHRANRALRSGQVAVWQG